MNPVFCSLLFTLFSCFRTRLTLQVEILALRHQVAVLQRARKRPSVQALDRLLWVWLSRVWGAMALSIGHSQAGDSDCLAAERVSTLLDLEEQGREERPTMR